MELDAACFLPPAPFLPCKPPLKGTATELLEEGDRRVAHAVIQLTVSALRFDGGMFMQRQIEASRDVGMVFLSSSLLA
eukprot:712980-Hanusia_phi.AAC.2